MTTLTTAGSINISFDGQIVENFDITGTVSSSGFSDVIIRNCWFHYPGGNAIYIENGNNATVQDCKFNDTAASTGQNVEPGEDIAVHMHNMTGSVSITRITVYDAVACYLTYSSAFFTCTFLEGIRQRSPDVNHGYHAWFQFNGCTGGGLVEDFSIVNPQLNSWSEDNFNQYASSGSYTFRRGLVDGNNSVAGVASMVENCDPGLTTSGLQGTFLFENIDAIHMGNGAFGVYGTTGVIYRSCRCKDTLQFDQGRGPAASGWTTFITAPDAFNTRFETCQYFNVNLVDLLWDASGTTYFDATNANFTARSPIVNVFPWETGTTYTLGAATFKNGSPALGPATITNSPLKNFVAVTFAAARPLIGDVRVLPASTFFNASPVFIKPVYTKNVTVNLFAATTGTANVNQLGNAPVFVGTLGNGLAPTGWDITGNDPTCTTLVNPGTVNGVTTYASTIRMISPGNSYMGIEHTFSWVPSQKYTISAWLRIPTGVSASGCFIYLGGASPVALNVNLSAQVRDTWVFSTIDYTALAGGGEGTFFGFMNPGDPIGTGFDVALPEIRVYAPPAASQSPFIGTPVYAKLTDKGFIALPRTTASPVIGTTATLKQKQVIDASLAIIGSDTFNAADQTTTITLSNGNLTATCNTATAEPQVRSRTGRATGKIHVEFTLTNHLVAATENIGFGLAAPTHSFANYLGSGDLLGMGIWPKTTATKIYLGGVGTSLGDMGGNTGDTWAMEVDFGALKVWFKNITGGTGWNNDILANQNPATATGGFSIATLSGTSFYLCANFENNVDDALTVNTGGSAYALTPSTGFRSFAESVSLGAPALTVVTGQRILAAADLATASPVLGPPVLKQAHKLVSILALASPVLGPAVLTQKQVITASMFAAASPVLGPAVLASPLALITLVLGDAMLDYGLNTFALANKIIVCSQSPVSYADALTRQIGVKNLGIGSVLASGPVDATPDGRKVTTVAVSGGVVTTNGMPVCWAVIDDANLRLLASGPMGGLRETVTTSDHFSLGAFTITVLNNQV